MLVYWRVAPKKCCFTVVAQNLEPLDFEEILGFPRAKKNIHINTLRKYKYGHIIRAIFLDLNRIQAHYSFCHPLSLFLFLLFLLLLRVHDLSLISGSHPFFSRVLNGDESWVNFPSWLSGSCIWLPAGND